ncbi:MAG: phosphoenolpyruvate--protein phosphotransferase [Planctomycetota bacterium]
MDRCGASVNRGGRGGGMETYYGIAVSPGIFIGPAFVLDDARRSIPRRHVPAAGVTRQLERLERALVKSVDDLSRVQADVASSLGKDAAAIFGFHIGMLSDEAVLGPIRDMIQSDRTTAEYAAHRVFGEWAERFGAMPDDSFRTKVTDLNDLSARVISHLAGDRADRLQHLDYSAGVVATELTPSQTVAFDREHVHALATDFGGLTSHMSIVARALGIPAVVGCGALSPNVTDETMLVIDGDEGLVVVDPDEQTLADFEREREQRRVYQLSLNELAELEAVTTDGVRIELHGNIEFPDEISDIIEKGGLGVGLYRTEFLYLTREREPTETEHFEAYKKCVELLDGRPLTIRTVDLGADKYTQSQAENPERNPFLGLRSIRYCLKNIPMFKTQLRAILRASALGPVRMMFPLITSLSELRQARYLVHDVMEDLAEEGVAFDRNVPMGMMVEVPSAAIQSAAFAREADFFSVGTNDLVQYTLAVDRTNERVAGLFNPQHPAVLKLIRDVVRSARRRDIPVSCCGESAGSLGFSLLLVGLGLRTLSVPSGGIPRLKRLFRSVDGTTCERIARRAISFDSDIEVSAYLRDQLRKLLPDPQGPRGGV